MRASQRGQCWAGGLLRKTSHGNMRSLFRKTLRSRCQARFKPRPELINGWSGRTAEGRGYGLFNLQRPDAGVRGRAQRIYGSSFFGVLSGEQKVCGKEECRYATSPVRIGRAPACLRLSRQVVCALSRAGSICEPETEGGIERCRFSFVAGAFPALVAAGWSS